MLTKEGITRRQFLTLIGVSGAGALLASCAPTSEKRTIDQIRAERIKNSSIIEERTPMAESRFNRHIKTMTESTSPLLTAIAKSLQDLYRNPTPPSGIPPWVDIWPLIVTHDKGLVSTALVSSPKYSNDFLCNATVPISGKLAQTRSYYQPQPLLRPQPVEMAIHIGSRSDTSELSFSEAFFLAKEALQLGLFMGSGQRYYDILTNYGFRFTDQKGEPITNPSDQELIGKHFFQVHSLAKLKNGNPYNKAVDGLPLIITALAIPVLMRNQPLSEEELKGIAPFTQALITLSSFPQSVIDKIIDIANEWTISMITSQSLVAPPNVIDLLHDDQVVAAILVIQAELETKRQESFTPTPTPVKLSIISTSFATI